MRPHPALAHAGRIVAAAYVLNAVWEWLHYPLYVCVWSRVPCALVSALTDTAIILGIWAAIALFLKDWSWTRELHSRYLTAAVVAALLVGWGVELFALYRGAWSYAPAMPIVPFLGVGLSPLLQLPITTMLAFVVAESMESDK
jgi:hypothetical protein